MKIKLTKKPKNPTIIEGFPGFGLVGTIVCEFLVEHLKTEKIGRVLLEEEPAMVAIHNGNLIEPFSVAYNEKFNLVIVHSMGVHPGTEWKVSDIIIAIAKELDAKEVISIEGVSSQDKSAKDNRVYFYSNDAKKSSKFSKIGLKPLKEGILMGVSSAMLLKVDKIPMSCVFAETDSALPDSKAAADVIKMLDKYLGLDVDYKPLLLTAKVFEEKVQKILTQTKTTVESKEKKAMSYVG